MKRKLKKYRPKRRLKISLAHSSKPFIFISWIVLLSFLVLSVIKSSSELIKIKKIPFTTNIINRINIESSNPKLKDDIEKYLSKFENTIYSKELSDEINNEISQNFPYLRVKSGFNTITGTLKITIEENKAIAIFENEKVYLLEDLTITTKIPPDNTLLPSLKIPFNSDKELLAKVKNLIQSRMREFGDKFSISKNKNELIFDYGGFKIIVFEDFKPTDKNIERIEKVLSHTRMKIDLPFILDARFIDDGKIIINPLK